MNSVLGFTLLTAPSNQEKPKNERTTAISEIEVLANALIRWIIRFHKAQMAAWPAKRRLFGWLYDFRAVSVEAEKLYEGLLCDPEYLTCCGRYCTSKGLAKKLDRHREELREFGVKVFVLLGHNPSVTLNWTVLE